MASEVTHIIRIVMTRIKWRPSVSPGRQWERHCGRSQKSILTGSTVKRCRLCARTVTPNVSCYLKKSIVSFIGARTRVNRDFLRLTDRDLLVFRPAPLAFGYHGNRRHVISCDNMRAGHGHSAHGAAGTLTLTLILTITLPSRSTNPHPQPLSLTPTLTTILTLTCIVPIALICIR